LFLPSLQAVFHTDTILFVTDEVIDLILKREDVERWKKKSMNKNSKLSAN
jgi:hypothetical protein